MVSGKDSYVQHSRSHGWQTTIQHWQLRDLICCGTHEDEVFLVNQNATFRCNTHTDEVACIQQLPFDPTSMTVGAGCIAAGGPDGQINVQRLSNGESIFQGAIGSSVNNALQITTDASGKPRLYACNNDKRVRIFELGSMDSVAELCTQVPINYAAMSPDGQTLACVGDSCEAYLYTITPTGYRFMIALDVGVTDAGMGCSWSHSGGWLATASQDGTASIWEMQRHRVVAQHRTSSACRNIKFSPSPVDLLAFSEHENFCHIIDARSLSSQSSSQQLRVPQTSSSPVELEDQGISGMTFSPSGRQLHVGLETSAVVTYQVDVADRISQGTCSLA